MHVGLLYRKGETAEIVKKLIASSLDCKEHASPFLRFRVWLASENQIVTTEVQTMRIERG
jgi:hypothetical protein